MFIKALPILMIYCSGTTSIPTQTPTQIDQGEELSISSIIKATSKAKSSGYFNYDPYSKWGPERWDDIKIKNSDYFDFTKVKKNQCREKK